VSDQLEAQAVVVANQEYSPDPQENADARRKPAINATSSSRAGDVDTGVFDIQRNERLSGYARNISYMQCYINASASVTLASGSWQIVPSSNNGSQGNHLYGTSAVSTDDVWAVGDYNDGPYKHFARTLTEHWDGQQWRTVASPNPLTGTDDTDVLTGWRQSRATTFGPSVITVTIPA
jgi:hypothetical protein